jgi:hypothetical protein
MESDSLVELALFGGAAFAAAFVAGLAGFAFGLVAMAIWLHLLTPAQTAILIMFYALIVQGYAVWKLRHALNPRRLLPFVIGGVLAFRSASNCCAWRRRRRCAPASASSWWPSASTACSSRRSRR